ncbi:MAG: HD-GYP domain-containing protein [Candidatus Eremiobacteraeota bacterium]|nr:HD-GYP domain-containing protein [Candidatus Eremiobacteraeota bacterium]
MVSHFDDTSLTRGSLSEEPKSQNQQQADRTLQIFSTTWDVNLLKLMNSRKGSSAPAGTAGAGSAGSVTPKSPLPHEPPKTREGSSGTTNSVISRFKDSSASSYEHSVRVGEIAGKLARQMNFAWNSKRAGQNEPGGYYKKLGVYHDIGKYAIPYEILEKPGALTDEEKSMIKEHPRLGEQLLKHDPEFNDLLPAVRHHHERWDGKGYPDGLKGNDIPVEARIISIADAFDAMISDRPYRKGMSREQAVDEINRCAGSQFDPEMVEIFTALLQSRGKSA